MLKVLLKKQLLEINRSIFFNQKTGDRRSKGAIAAFIGLFAVLLLFLMAMFGFAAYALATIFIPQRLSWFYFSAVGGLSILFGVFGSVFNTYATLFLAKDNDLLLSMPIPVKYILISRLLGVYLMGLIYSALVSLPGAIIYIIIAKTGVKGVIGSLSLIVLISVFVFILSCGLGYIVAKVATKLKNRGIVTAIISLVFIGLYYFCYSQATEILRQLRENGEAIAGIVRNFAYPLYAFGKAGEGEPIFLFCVSAVFLLLLYIVYLLLSKSFLKIATSTAKSPKSVYNGKPIKQKTVFGALLKKEFKRFTSSANYMLNCAIGSVFMIAAGIAALVKLSEVFNYEELAAIMSGFAPTIAIAGVMLISSMNTITAPSISLEGKNLWIVKTLPLDARLMLKAKVFLHVIVTLVPAAFLSVCLSVSLKLTPVVAIISFAITVVFVFLSAEFGLLLNLSHPNLKWSNETAVIKQSLPVFIAMFAGMIFSAAIGAASFFLGSVMAHEYSSLIILVFCAALLAAIHLYLSKTAEKKLAEL